MILFSKPHWRPISVELFSRNLGETPNCVTPLKEGSFSLLLAQRLFQIYACREFLDVYAEPLPGLGNHCTAAVSVVVIFGAALALRIPVKTARQLEASIRIRHCG